MSEYLHESSKIIKALDATNPDLIVTDRGNLGSGGFNFGKFAKGSIAEKLEQEKKLIETWRELSQMPKVENALMDIWNEAVVADSKDPINILLSDIDFGEGDSKNEKMKERIAESFSRVLKKLNFRNDGTKIFKRWYVDGRHFIYFEKDEKGITDLRFLDPLKMKLVSEGKEEFFEYTTEKGFTVGHEEEKINIPRDKVIFVPSGLRSKDGLWLSYLNKAVRPMHLLNLLENSLVIHRFVRAPERWVFKVDVSSMSKKRAKQYMDKLRSQYRSKFVINPVTGELTSENSTLAMQDNIYIPKTGSQNGGHEIDTIGGSSSFGDIEDILYYKEEVSQALNLPERTNQDSMMVFGGRSEEITRAEYRWFRFIKWLRKYFNVTFLKLMEIDLVANKILKKGEFEKIKNDIGFEYENDSIYEESKRINKITMKLEMLRDYAELAEEWYGADWVYENLCGVNDEAKRKKMIKEREERKKKMDKGGGW